MLIKGLTGLVKSSDIMFCVASPPGVCVVADTLDKVAVHMEE